MLQWLRPSTGSNDSTATGASSPLNVKWNEAALPVALYFNVLAVEMQPQTKASVHSSLRSALPLLEVRGPSGGLPVTPPISPRSRPFAGFASPKFGSHMFLQFQVRGSVLPEQQALRTIVFNCEQCNLCSDCLVRNDVAMT